MIQSERLCDPPLRRAALELYGRVWPHLPDAIAQARRWGSDWFDVSTPSFLCAGGQMIAHAGQVWCDLILDGTPTRVAALHGILVDPAHRGRGHGRAVIEAALERLDIIGAERVILWSEKTDFYRRFGFRPIRESAFRCAAPSPSAVESRILDVQKPHDFEILRQLLRARAPVSQRYAAADDGWHFLIDCAIDRPSRDSIRYLPARNAIVIASTPDPSTLRVADVIASELPDLQTIAGAFAPETQLKTIELLFSPDRFTDHAESFEHPDEELLQVRGIDVRASDAEAFSFSPFTRT